MKEIDPKATKQTLDTVFRILNDPESADYWREVFSCIADKSSKKRLERATELMDSYYYHAIPKIRQMAYLDKHEAQSIEFTLHNAQKEVHWPAVAGALLEKFETEVKEKEKNKWVDGVEEMFKQ